jgi:hypothetical protein
LQSQLQHAVGQVGALEQQVQKLLEEGRRQYQQLQHYEQQAAAAAGTQAAAAAAVPPASVAAPGTPVGALLQGRRPTRSQSPGKGRSSLLLAAA